jgi:carboxymethylenebutenolidase
MTNNVGLLQYGDHPDARGYLAMPASGEGPGVLVLHAWWGLNDTIRSICTRLADTGFVAFAPDLYRGKIADTIPGAEALAKTLGEQADADLAAATRFLSERANAVNGLAVIGFSLGAYFALQSSAVDPQNIRSVVIFYGIGGGDFSASQASYLGHFAENDDYEPRPGVDELEATLRSAGRPVTFHHYPGTGHWFFEPDRTDAYNPEAANMAWDRTLAFLRHPATE